MNAVNTPGLLKRLRQVFGSTPSDTLLWSSHVRIFQQARWGVIVIYAFQLYLALKTIPQWSGMASREGLLPLWPVAWMNALPYETAIYAVLMLFLTGSLLGAVLGRYRIGRIAAFFGLLQFVAWNNSYGKIGHSLHVLLFISFVLIFLPTGWHLKASNRTTRQHTLFTYWSAQAVPLIAYSMAGMVKVGCGIYQLAVGQASVFGPEGLPRHVADRLLQTGSETLLGPWVIENAWLVLPGMWITLYLELFALYALFRPATRIWFVGGLLIFHAASYFTMTIWFPQNCFLLLLLMLLFPATARRPALTLSSLQSLPLLGAFFRTVNGH
ncbi:MAG: hypothetical protein AAF649_01405 [Verrucomicrobiota bacterium]